MTDKKKLPVLGKSLMPEVLPPPAAPSGLLTPRQRVIARLRQIASNSAALAAAAALSTNCESSNGGYGVVDPLPPPAGSGGGGMGGFGAQPGHAGGGTAGAAGGGGQGGISGIGQAGVGSGGGAAGDGGQSGVSGAAGGGGQSGVSGAAGGGGLPPWIAGGYGVVDPLPPPAYCEPSRPEQPNITSATWKGNTIQVTLSFRTHEPPITFKPNVVAPVRVSQLTSTGFTLDVVGGVWPAEVAIDLEVRCENEQVHFSHPKLVFDTSKPVDLAEVPFQIEYPDVT